MFDFENKTVFDVTDGPSGIKYVVYYDFLKEYYKDDERSVDFRYMNFPAKDESIVQIIEQIKAFCKEHNIRYYNFGKTIFGCTGDFYFNTGYGDENNITTYQVEASGSPEFYDKLFEFLENYEIAFDKTDPQIQWFFRDSSGMAKKTIRFDKNPNEAKDIFYPFVTTKDGAGAEEYMKRYLASPSSILILIGEPGTGKTTLVRDFIYKNDLKAHVTFDESLISDDNFFVNFITDDAADVLVMEDCDVLLTSRENDSNKIMAKFLNISEGLVDHKNKKMIFTTNLTNINRIDSALIRPGRCFGVLEFRKLAFSEANTIRKEIGKPLLEVERSYPLSEIFSSTESNIKKRSMGMV